MWCLIDNKSVGISSYTLRQQIDKYVFTKSTSMATITLQDYSLKLQVQMECFQLYFIPQIHST